MFSGKSLFILQAVFVQFHLVSTVFRVAENGFQEFWKGFSRVWNSSIVESMPKANMVAINVSIIKSTTIRISISSGSSVKKRLNRTTPFSIVR